MEFQQEQAFKKKRMKTYMTIQFIFISFVLLASFHHFVEKNQFYSFSGLRGDSNSVLRDSSVSTSSSSSSSSSTITNHDVIVNDTNDTNDEIDQDTSSISSSSSGRISKNDNEELTSTTHQKYKYPHDHPNHPWHWTRSSSSSSSSSFSSTNNNNNALDKNQDCNNKLYQDLYHEFHTNGFVLFTSCSLQHNIETVLHPVANLTQNLQEHYIHNLKLGPVRDLALDEDIIEFLEYLHNGGTISNDNDGMMIHNKQRKAFPFQTINHKIGIEQSIHSDLIHIDTYPRTLMAGAWTALEDLDYEKNQGDLIFYPTSHHYGTWDFEDIGFRFDVNGGDDHGDKQEVEQRLMKDFTNSYSRKYSEVLEEKMKILGIEPYHLDKIQKGQTIIWSASVLHGDDHVIKYKESIAEDGRDENEDGNDSNKDNSNINSKDKEIQTRLSQVTHYFFEGAEYYWAPRLSQPSENKIKYLDSVTPCRMNEFMPRSVNSCADKHIEEFKKKFEL